MFDEYRFFRRIGHGRVESLKRGSKYLLSDLLSPFTETRLVPPEAKLERDLSTLERVLDPNYKSNCVKPYGDLKLGPSLGIDEWAIMDLYSVYHNDRPLFSPEQIRRYEDVVEKMRASNPGLVDALKRDDPEGYEREKYKAWYSKNPDYPMPSHVKAWLEGKIK